MPSRPSKNRAPTTGNFLRSLRVDQDFDSESVAESYILTSNALRATERVVDSIQNGIGGAWTLVGPFGTGKSAFCLYLAHLLTASDTHAAQCAFQKLRQADAKLAKRLFPSPKNRIGFKTLLVSGSPEPISTAILRSILTSPGLQRRRATASVQSKAKSLLRGMQKRKKPLTQDVAALVASLADAMKGRAAEQGLLLVLDELGQFLEYAAKQEDPAEVFLLQLLAELAARSNGRLAIVGVLHQDFREYAAMLPGVEQAEWEKIRGRFEDIAFEEPPSQLLRFVSAASTQCRQADGLRLSSTDTRLVTKLASQLWDLEVAPPSLSRKEGVALIKSCTPLHPLTAVLLGPVFRRVGQNERSAFSVLASDEPTALRAWRASKGTRLQKLFDIVDLYEHLLSSFGNALLHTADAKRWAEAIESESRNPHLSASAVIVLRAVALLGIASRWYGVRASRNVLLNALSSRFKQDVLDCALAELRSASVIVHRKYNDSFVVWEGSDVDVEARLDEGRSRLRETIGAATLLDRHYRVRPLLARRHSFKSGTLRFFDVRFADESQLEEIAAEDMDSDGRIVIVLADCKRAVRLPKAKSKCFDGRTLVLAVPADDGLTRMALELAALHWVEANTPELNNDKTAQRELFARKADLDKQLRFLVERLLSTTTAESKWFCGGVALRISERRQLNEHLSRICDEIFADAPRIDNEIINRQELSSSAAAARRNLIECMIDQKGKESLALAGNPPERSIYRSLLSDEGLGLHRRHRGGWGFRVPPPSHRDKPDSGYKLFEAIKGFLNESEESPRPVSELFDVLRQPPFGLRDGPIPVLICAALLAREADVALYREGEFQPLLSSALFQDLIKRPDDFAVRQLRISGVRSEVFDKLGSLLGQMDVTEQSAKQQVLTIARLLMRFSRSLPEYSQKTDGLTRRTRSVRTSLLTAKEPETMLLADLPQAVGVPPFKANDRRRSDDVESYVSRLKKAIVELRDCYPKLTTSVWRSVGDAFTVGTEPSKIRAALRDRASALAEFVVERDMRMLVERMMENSASDEDWLGGVASLLAERLPAKWRDEDVAHFGIRLRQYVRRFALLEATVAHRPKSAKLNGAESIRVALTSTRFGQADHAIHLDSRKEAQARAIEEKLGDLLDGSDPTVAVAALCRLLHSRVAGDASSRELTCEGVNA